MHTMIVVKAISARTGMIAERFSKIGVGLELMLLCSNNSMYSIARS
jgi:hypothetical protein